MMPWAFQDWLSTLPMQQQSVLVLATRGPDGLPKEHPTKKILKYYRAHVLKAAYFGRPMRVDEAADTFMTMSAFTNEAHWQYNIVKPFFQAVDALPHHFYLHLMHGAEIIGYRHPDELSRRRWSDFYFRCCFDMHVEPESMAAMDRRLGDWDRRHWLDAPTAATPDEQLVEQANELARNFYAAHGYEVAPGYRFDRATHPQERLMWYLAVVAFEQLRDTDIEDALSNLEDA